MMHSRLLSLTLISLISLSTGCVTASKKKAANKKPVAGEVKAKPGTKEKTGTSAEAGTPTTTVEKAPPPSVEQQMKFFKTHVIPESAFGEDDIYFLSTIPTSPDSGSIAEAVLTIGVLRSVINPSGAMIKPSFEEEDLAAKSGDVTKSEGTAGKEKTGPALEKLFKEKGIDLADALSVNPLLASYSVASMVRQALTAGSDTPDYQNEVVNILKKTAGKWEALNRSFGGEPAAQDQEKPYEPKLMTDAQGNVYDANAPKNGDESAIGEAQKLADAGQYQEAIRTASSIAVGHPSFPVAQEKIKEFSNKAVQQLRKKAAAAFQSAMPIGDAKVKAQYLRQAKAFLEEAIKDYPQATQLPTVRDNLSVIARDLEKIE